MGGSRCRKLSRVAGRISAHCPLQIRPVCRNLVGCSGFGAADSRRGALCIKATEALELEALSHQPPRTSRQAPNDSIHPSRRGIGGYTSIPAIAYSDTVHALDNSSEMNALRAAARVSRQPAPSRACLRRSHPKVRAASQRRILSVFRTFATDQLIPHR